MILTAAVSLWVTASDVALANSAREAAVRVRDSLRNQPGQKWFQGHWGFQYYMQNFGFVPDVADNPDFRAGDVVVFPDNNTEQVGLPPNFSATEQQSLNIETGYEMTTIGWRQGAGFYSSYWGPLPFAIGDVPAERYWILRLEATKEERP